MKNNEKIIKKNKQSSNTNNSKFHNVNLLNLRSTNTLSSPKNISNGIKLNKINLGFNPTNTLTMCWGSN